MSSFTAVSLAPGAGAGASERLAIYRFHPPAVAALMLSGGFFFASGSPFEQHPLAFVGVREIFLSLCVAAAFLHVVRMRGALCHGDLLVLALAPTAMLTSALFAEMKFGQPIIYGLFEERRWLAFYALFLIRAAVRGAENPTEALLGALNWSALFYVSLAVFLQTGALGDLAERGVPSLDPRKYRILPGINIYAASVATAVILLLRQRVAASVAPLCIGVFGLLVVGQTRSVNLQLLLGVVAVLVVAGPRRLAALAIGLSCVTPILALWLIPFIASGQSVGSGELDVRLATIRTIMSALAANDYIGMGALSLQWQNGFHRVYTSAFYLMDVGLFGDLYRFGFLTPFFYGALVAAVVAYLRVSQPGVQRSLVVMLMVLASMGLFSQGLLAQSGADWALAFALASEPWARRSVFGSSS